jgi:hypothetical protein
LTKCKIPKYRKKPECKALLKTPLNWGAFFYNIYTSFFIISTHQVGKIL